MIENPRADELVDAVAQWIDSIRPGLPPRDAFLARVAANGLSVVKRELQLGPLADAAAIERLSSLLGETGDVQTLHTLLCAKLRAGEMDAETPGLLAALKANITDQIAIDQPNYKHEGSG